MATNPLMGGEFIGWFCREQNIDPTHVAEVMIVARPGSPVVVNVVMQSGRKILDERWPSKSQDIRIKGGVDGGPVDPGRGQI